MKSQKKIVQWSSMVLVAAMLSIFGCKLTNEPSSSSSSPPPLNACAKISDKDQCQKNDQCFYDVDHCTDAAAHEKGTCAAIKVASICNIPHRQSSDGKSCIWDATKSPAVCVIGPQTIYTWNKIALPGSTTTLNNIPNLVMSKDKAHLYAYNDKAAEKGLYHSADAGITWTRLGPAANGVLMGKVKTGAADSSYDSSAAAPLTLIATEKGAVVHVLSSVYLLDGANVLWGIDKTTNNDGAAAANSVADFKDLDVVFADVVMLNGVESVVFGQANRADTHYYYWNHPTMAEHDKAPERVKVFKAGAGGNLTDDQHWVRAGNSHDGDLLLASVSSTNLATGSGLWRVAAANTRGWGAPSADIGKVTLDTALLFPEDGKPWDTGATTPFKKNLKINLIGSFDNGGAPEYFAALTTGNGSGTVLGIAPALANRNAVGGLAHFTGPQTGNDARVDFMNSTFTSLSSFGGHKRFFPGSSGGVNANGTPAPNPQFQLQSLTDKKNEMMTDKSAVPLNDSNNGLLDNILGDDDLSYFVIYTVGIYSRTKGLGYPRP